MGRPVSILIFVFFVSTAARAAGDTTLHLRPEKTIAGSFNNFYIDNLGNIFLVTKSNQVKKLNQNLDSIAVFNDVRRYGDIYLLDVNNPLKITVYYKDFTTAVVLDRYLNIRNTIDLRAAGILQAKAVARSYDNNYWVFDELDNTIKKIDDNGSVLQQSADFRNLFAETYNPNRIIDENGLLYLYDEKKGWLLFDYYGAYKQHIQLPGWRDVQVSGNNILGHDSMFLYLAGVKTFSNLKMRPGIIISDAIKIQRQLSKIFVLEKDGLHIYSIQ
ncbi:MAG TPA: hypothetical protein PLA68_06040 [Panacibacter sp.]|nr:hypothetical protein [Panacibacter sp.]